MIIIMVKFLPSGNYAVSFYLQYSVQYNFNFQKYLVQYVLDPAQQIVFS